MKRVFALFLVLWFVLSIAGCGSTEENDGLGNGWIPERTMELRYATQFQVDYYPGGYKLITLGDGSRFLVIPEGCERPKRIHRDIVSLYQPIENIYLAATAAMCLFDGMDRLDAIRLSSLKAEDWYIENARTAMENGEILYAGKYSAPDYELIMESGCKLAVESTMIGHAAEEKEKLEELGIPVLMDQSSHEPHPLGRTEWLKLYAALLNEEEKAENVFSQQTLLLDEVSAEEPTGKTVVFFQITSSGFVVARKSGDYVSKMIELAGGKYVFDHLGDPSKATSTVTIEMETFYDTARTADYIIYNGSIGGGVRNLEEFLALNPLLAEFKAVQDGKVWCTGENMFQETLQLGQMIQEIHHILKENEPDLSELEFIYCLQ